MTELVFILNRRGSMAGAGGGHHQRLQLHDCKAEGKIRLGVPVPGCQHRRRQEAARFGIDADRAVNYKCDKEGTALNYEVISVVVCSVRSTQALSADWKRRIDEDVEKRRR